MIGPLPRDDRRAAPPRRVALEVLPGGAAATATAAGRDRPAARPALRLVWSADRAANAAARTTGPAPSSVAPHAGAACRLYSPAPGPTSSATRARGRRWVLEFEPTRRQEPDPLIGWTGGADPLAQVRLEFPTREAALAYVRRHGLTCQVSEPRAARATPRPYAENFLVPDPAAWPELLLAA